MKIRYWRKKIFLACIFLIILKIFLDGDKFKNKLTSLINKSNNIFISDKLRPDDTFIIGYPKSGTLWLTEIVWLLKHNLDFKKASRSNIHRRFHYLDNTNFYMSWLHFSPRIYKTHLRLKDLPEDLNKKAKVVYIVRNIKDTLVSYYFYKNALDKNAYKDIGTLIENMTSGYELFGTWWDHVNEYTSLPNVHIVHYEDLIEYPDEEILKLGQYFDVDIDEETLKYFVRFVEFKNMKNSSRIEYPFLYQIDDKSFKHLRKGEIGNWKSYLSEEISQQIDNITRQRLKYTNPIRYEPSL